MKFLAIASVLAASSLAMPYTGQNVELFNGNIDEIGKVQVIGSGSATGKIDGNTATGDATGTLKVISEKYGQVNVEGAISGTAGTDGKSSAFVDAAVSGRATGPYGVNVAGAAHGKASGDLDGNFAADGAANGDASAYGYNIRGAVQGGVAGQVDVHELSGVNTIEGLGAITDFSKAAAAINGCYTDKAGKTTCTAFDNRGNPNAKWNPVSGQQWYGQQMYNGAWNNGVWVPTGSGSGSGSRTVSQTRSPTATPAGDLLKKGTQTPQPYTPQSNSANGLMVSGVLSVLAGVAALLL
jgi:hypothetical protein